MLKYDVHTVVKALMEKQLPERPELVKEFKAAIQQEPVVKLFMAELMKECLEKGKNPAELCGVSLMYGMVIGVQAEKLFRNEIIIAREQEPPAPGTIQ